MFRSFALPFGERVSFCTEPTCAYTGRMPKKRTVYMAHARTEAQRANMRRIEKDGVNPFDWKHVETYHKEPVLRRGKYWLVTPNDFPYEGAKLHLLLIYKDNVRLPSETKPAAWTELRAHLAWIEKTYRIKGGALTMRFGEPAYTGASVHHLHLHVIAGAKRNANAAKLRVSVGYMHTPKKNAAPKKAPRHRARG